MEKKRSIVRRRPAETAAPVALAASYLAARLLGVADESDVVWSLAIVLAFVPTAVTWLVETIRG